MRREPFQHWHRFQDPTLARMARIAKPLGSRMQVDAVANFAYGIVATAPSPATTGTTLVLQSGQGAALPATPFDLLMWPANSIPLNSTAEIARCTNVATDTLTLTRGQYGTTKQPVAIGYQCCQPIDANLISQLETGPGAILATHVYAPSPAVTYTLNTSALTVVDATNATLAFTVPPSGIVDVSVEAYYATNPSGIINIGLKNHSGGAQVGQTAIVLDVSASVIVIARLKTTFHLTGLTPGVLQLDLAAYTGGSVTSDIVAFGFTGTSTAGGGPLIMQAVASV